MDRLVKRQLQWALTIFVGIIVFVGGGSLLVRHAIWPQIQRLPFIANRDVVPFHQHHGLDPEISSLIFGNALLQTSDAPPPFLEDEVVYLPVSFLAYHFDRFLFWDEGAQVLIVTTCNEILVFNPGRTSFYLDGFPHELDNPILAVDGDVFMPACLAEGLYPITVRHYAAYNIVVVENAAAPYTKAELANRTNIRYQPDNRSPIAVRATSGSSVIVFEESEDGEFIRVRNEDGLLGWVPASSVEALYAVSPHNGINERNTILGDFVNHTTRRPSMWPAGQPVVIAWDDISEQAVNYSRMQAPLYEGINVLAPTWFRLDDAATGITSIGCREYTAWAQAEGVQVWPVFEVPAGHVGAFLTDRAARTRVINQLIRYIDELNLDGINIDFEPLGAAEGPYFMQFLREFAPRLGRRNVVLSVNVSPHGTAFYRRELLSLTVDFVIVMALDEHGQNSELSGPVASMPFVQAGIDNLMVYISSEQLVLGLPFYNRVWREVIGNNTPQTRREFHFGTAYTREWFEYNDAEWEWMPDIGSYYGGFVALEGDETVRYRVWLECERSMDEKLQIARARNLAGVSVWNRNFRHNDELWEVIGRHFGN